MECRIFFGLVPRYLANEKMTHAGPREPSKGRELLVSETKATIFLVDFLASRLNLESLFN